MSDVQSLMWSDENWLPTTDLEVSKLLKMVQDSEKETNRIISTGMAEVNELEEIMSQAKNKHDMLVNKVSNLLEHFILNEVDEDDLKETDTMLKYKVARGQIVYHKPSKKIVKPSEAVMSQLADVANGKYSKEVTKVETNWTELKKDISVNDDGVAYLKSTGELLKQFPVITENGKVSISYT